ncbi:hypothetical protein MEBOL_007287 [Melittangium boletus DSM 14713]|uniref:Lipoprotein n=2 Tax=Melittangium boletus TaxID=83453 RepID=A0A250IPV5_9BACT|nr:hypothetical protein MEBOL_007287 [Melittangium boletus DSM 14713]
MVRRSMRALSVLVLLLLSLPAWAQPPELPLTGFRDRVMLIWGGGKTREEAERFVASYQERAKDWARALELAPGYPRVFEGTEVPGLRPGAFFVALGVCEAGEGARLGKVFQALDPLSTTRGVLWEEGASSDCPAFLPGWSFGTSARLRVPEGTLAAASFNYAEEGKPPTWMGVVALLKKGDAESIVLEPPEDDTVSEVKRLKAGRGELVLEEALSEPPCDTGARTETHTRTWHVSARKGEIVTRQEKKPLRHAPCDSPAEDSPGE